MKGMTKHRFQPSRFLWMGGVLTLLFGVASCGGAIDGYGTYCLELTPSTYDFGCLDEQVTIQVTNVCGSAVSFGEPIVNESCGGRIVIEGESGLIEDGESLFFEVSYSAIDDGPWNCGVTFIHDFPTEPEPELPLAGGGETCL